ncbi:hypothetical protein A2982_03375 [candidate division WWE3 bacterium RIFCSPLOWO2_01_FULL_39_13]|uniref:Uncharacterized protein n=1 Tax=candidate division WWE3 bacterium RIFCSPLOWO2_01_FULL_39_13 TaxID=1802624 RepID=A0A1F4V378_UNCKA|nr:MAG: hypothetical protein A2982_03375 [candidate division WWE3 bacterium RIFCSPLOWO2_01_FULL_39_13]
MRKIINTSALIVFLAVLLALPLGTFWFEGYEESQPQMPLAVDSAVLGVVDTKAINKNPAVDVAEEISLKLNLGKSRTEKFYNVLPEKYLGDSYKVIAAVPNDLAEKGVEAKLIMNPLSADLEVSMKDDSLAYSEISLFLIVLK